MIFLLKYYVELCKLNIPFIIDFLFQIRRMCIRSPSLLMREDNEEITMLFDLLHNEIGFSHESLRRSPEVLAEGDALTAKQRHLFLATAERAQYDPSKPLYVSPKVLVLETDANFATTVAGQSIDVMNDFLKTV